jgi:arsenate reductase
VKLLRPTRHPAAVEGSNIEKERAFMQAFKYLRNRIGLFLNLPFASLDAMSLRAHLREIGQGEGATATPARSG